MQEGAWAPADTLKAGKTSQVGLGLSMKTRNKINGLARASQQSFILLLWSRAAVGCGKPGWLDALITAMCVCRVGNFASTGSYWQGKGSAAHASVSSVQI